MCNLYCFMNQLAGKVPCIWIGCNVSHIYLQNTSYCAERYIREQLIPDQLLNGITDIQSESTAVKGFLHLCQEAFFIFYQHTCIGLADATTSYMAHAKYCTIIFSGTNNDSFLWYIFHQQMFMTSTVLQGKKMSMFSNDILIAFQCNLREDCLYKQNYQIYIGNAFCTGNSCWMIGIGHTVFINLQSVRINRIYYALVGIYNIDFVIL